MTATIETIGLPPLLRSLVRVPWPVKRSIATHPFAWRVWSGVCRRIGWNATRIGWHAAANGPYAGIRLRALHPNHLWVPLGTYEPYISYWLVRLLKEEMWGAAGKDVWDIGANVGTISLLCAKANPGLVVAFEPSAANLDHLRENVKANPDLAQRIEIVGQAVSDKDGELEFAEGSESEVNQLVHDEVRAWGRRGDNPKTVRVQTVRLDSLLEQGRAAPGLLKIDVEGAEALVLAGAKTLLHDFHPAIMVEVHNAEAAAASVALLRQADYYVRRIEGKRLLDLSESQLHYGHLVAVSSHLSHS